MAAFTEIQEEEATETSVDVNIAIFGSPKTGKSSFVNLITGLNEDDENKARPKNCGKDEKPAVYFNPKHPNIKFAMPFFAKSKKTVKFANIKKYDVCLLFFTDCKITDRLLMFAEECLSCEKPFFLIRSKIDSSLQSEKTGAKSKENKAEEIRTKIVKDLEKRMSCNHEIFLLSNNHVERWDFFKLLKAIASELPSSKKTCFEKTPKVQELTLIGDFQNFLKEADEREKSVTKMFPDTAEIKKFLVNSGISGVQSMMNEKLEGWKNVKINLAVVGQSGTGKSSFINAIRGVEESDEKYAAKTGITETTLIPRSYKHPSNPNIYFWDLPGIGTPTFPDPSIFFDKFAIDKYDTYLILTATRFSEIDRLLAEKVKSMCKSFFFVRTKIDNDRKNEKKRLKDSFDEQTMLHALRQDCDINLKQIGFEEQEVFLVSSRKPELWDFDRLKKAILDKLPSAQREALTFSLNTHSKEMVSEKIKVLKDRVWMVAVASVASKVSLGPIANALSVDGVLIKNQVKFYSKSLEFPQKGSKEFNCLSKGVQDKLEQLRPEHSNSDEFLQWLKSFDHDNTYNIRMYGKMLITKKTLKFVYQLLKLILDDMEKIAFAIIEETAASKGEDDDDDDDDDSDDDDDDDDD